MPRKTTTAAQNPPIDVHTTIQMPNSAPAEKKTEDKPDFFSYMASLTPEDWKNHIVYLTRENPKTSINGMGGYLTKLQQSFDIEDIKTAYGGYEFSYIMKKGTDLIYSGRFKVEAPPRYDPARETTPAPAAAAPDNGSGALVQQFIGVLREELARSRENAGSSAGTDQVVQMLTSASEKAVEMVSKRVPEAGNATSQLREVVAALKDMGIIGAPVLQQKTLLEQVKELFELPVLGSMLAELMKPKNPLDQLTQVNQILDIATKIRGDGEDTPKDWKAMGVRMIAERLPEILDALKPAAPGAPPATRTPGRAPAPAPAAVGGLRVVPRDSAEAVAPTAAVGNEPPIEAAVAAVPQVELTIEQDAQVMKVNVVNMFRHGASGASIASYIEDVNPEFAKDFLTYSPQQIRLFFSQDAMLKLIVDDPRFDEVLEEAREFMAEEDEPSPTPVSV